MLSGGRGYVRECMGLGEIMGQRGLGGIFRGGVVLCRKRRIKLTQDSLKLSPISKLMDCD